MNTNGTCRNGQNAPVTNLSECGLDVDAEVVEAPCNTSVETRLREIGLVPGVRVRVIRSGSRIVLQVGEGRVAMRREDASTIRVRALDRTFSPGGSHPPAAT
ncbi:MAG: FeoA family protein [Gemmatimonadetes bacterium]|nr:FeoA family protein [Gemmatimonadota bacterium]